MRFFQTLRLTAFVIVFTSASILPAQDDEEPSAVNTGVWSSQLNAVLTAAADEDIPIVCFSTMAATVAATKRFDEAIATETFTAFMEEADVYFLRGRSDGSVDEKAVFNWCGSTGSAPWLRIYCKSPDGTVTLSKIVSLNSIVVNNANANTRAEKIIAEVLKYLPELPEPEPPEPEEPDPPSTGNWTNDIKGVLAEAQFDNKPVIAFSTMAGAAATRALEAAFATSAFTTYQQEIGAYFVRGNSSDADKTAYNWAMTSGNAPWLRIYWLKADCSPVEVKLSLYNLITGINDANARAEAILEILKSYIVDYIDTSVYDRFDPNETLEAAYPLPFAETNAVYELSLKGHDKVDYYVVPAATNRMEYAFWLASPLTVTTNIVPGVGESPAATNIVVTTNAYVSVLNRRGGIEVPQEPLHNYTRNPLYYTPPRNEPFYLLISRGTNNVSATYTLAPRKWPKYYGSGLIIR